jgi:hypothetical protein
VWNSLYRAGGAAALAVAMLLLAEIAVFIVYPLPHSAVDYFALFQHNRLIGLVEAYLLETVGYILYIPFFLALYVALRAGQESSMVLALALAGVGIAVFLASTNPFALLTLADQYAAADTEAHRSQFVAAGQALLANTNQRAVGGFNLGLFLVSLAGLIISVVMLSSTVFSRATAYTGVVANALSLADYVRLIFAPDALLLVLLLALASGVLLLAWYMLAGRTLLRLGRL